MLISNLDTLNLASTNFNSTMKELPFSKLAKFIVWNKKYKLGFRFKMKMARK
jgi:hypothetical protein